MRVLKQVLLKSPKPCEQAPLAGRWSDRYGRKKFIGLFLFTGTLAPLVMALHISSGLSLYFYFPAQVYTLLSNL